MSRDTSPAKFLGAVTFVLMIGFFTGLRAAATFTPSHHRWMAPPVPANLAFRPFPSPIVLYESLTISSGASTPVSALTTGIVPAESMPPDNRPAAGQALRGYATGRASWHATGRDGLYAAAGPALRRALGPTWRGLRVSVCATARCIRVTLNDFCPCDTAEPPKLIDLSDEAFAQLAPLSRGVIKVEVGGF